MTLFILIIFILFCQITIIYGQIDDGNFMNSMEFDPPDLPFPNIPNGISEEFLDRLNDSYPGNTFPYKDLSDIITDSRMENDEYELQFNPRITDLLDSTIGRILIGQWSNIDQILTVQISFHSNNGDTVRDPFGNPIVYTSNRQDFGHILDILHQGFMFSYAKFLLKLQPNSTFDPHSLFFHFLQSSLSTTTQRNNITGIITGSTRFSIDSLRQMYNVSINCSIGFTCMWLLDNDAISNSANTSVILPFDSRHIGNRTLSYVGYNENVPQTLASLPLSILPSTKQECNNLPRRPANIWLPAGPMSSPRIYFTATYLSTSEDIMIAGGASDDSTALSSVDIYDPDTGCYNVLNMTSPRMQHTATYYNNSDVVLLIGGIREIGQFNPNSEFVSTNNTESYQSMKQPRRFHSIGIVNNSDILIVGGQEYNNSLQSLEIYNRSSSTFQQLQLSDPQLKSLEGHSVTSLSNRGTVLILGGYNGTSHPGIGLITDGMNFTSAVSIEFSPSSDLQFAHHQATYIPQIDAVLITGGDNGQQTRANAYLYYPTTQILNATNSMLTQRSFHAAVRLSNGSVLIIGGAAGMHNNQPISPIESVERYDVDTNTFTSVPFLNIARYRHQAVLLPNNKVFVFGGIGASGKILSSVEYIMLDNVNQPAP